MIKSMRATRSTRPASAPFVSELAFVDRETSVGNRLSIARADWKPFTWMTLFTVTGWQICMAFGVYLMPAGRASIIGSTAPIWVVLVSVWILREQLTADTAAGIGAGLVLIGPEITVVHSAPLGSVLMLLGAVFMSSGAI